MKVLKCKPLVLVSVMVPVCFFMILINSNGTTQSQVRKPPETVTMKLLGTFKEGESFRGAVPVEEYEQVRRAAFRVQTSYRKAGGKHISYSSNGEYKIEKEVHASEKEIEYVITTLYDRSGTKIWEGKTGFNVIVSNNGRTLVSKSSEDWGLTFYDIGSSEPVEYYPGEWGILEFSEDGRYLIACTSRILHLFSADGDLLWSKEFRMHGGKDAVISSNGSYILVNDRTATASAKKRSEPITEGKSKERLDVSDIRPIQRQPVHLEPSTESYVTLLRNDGSIIREICLPIYHPHHMTFSPDDGKYASVAGGEKLAFLETDSGEVLWVYEVGEPGHWIGPIAVSVSGEYIVFGAADGRDGKPLNMRYELLNISGKKIEQVEISYSGNKLTFSYDSRYLVVWNNGLKKLKIMEIIKQ